MWSRPKIKSADIPRRVAMPPGFLLFFHNLLLTFDNYYDIVQALEGFTMNKTVTRATLWVNRIIFAVLLILLPAMPFLLRWYRDFRGLTPAAHIALIVAFYICAVFTGFALLKLGKLLRNILHEKVFVRENVRHIRQIAWCCGLVSLVCTPATFFYLPLIFMVIIMAFLCLVVSILSQVMAAAVAIREENDLTI